MEEPKRATYKVSIATTAFVIYGTLILLVIAIPQSVTNWLRDMNPSAVQSVLLQAATGLEMMSKRVDLNAAYVRGRALFLSMAGKNESDD